MLAGSDQLVPVPASRVTSCARQNTEIQEKGWKYKKAGSLAKKSADCNAQHNYTLHVWQLCVCYMLRFIHFYQINKLNNNVDYRLGHCVAAPVAGALGDL